MKPLARIGDLVTGGIHCHGHDHGPRATPGRIREGASRVFASGRPAARAGDEAYSPQCCAGIGRIVLLQSQAKVYIEGKPAASVGTPTIHCDTAPGRVATGDAKVFIVG